MARRIKERKYSGTKDPSVLEYEILHAALSRRAAAEGMVLLKNEDGILPLAKDSKTALFGAGAVVTVKGGTGSGDVNERKSVTILEGMEAAGFNITTKNWLSDYLDDYNAARNEWKKKILEKEKAGVFFFFAYAETLFTIPAGPDVYKTDTDTCIYVLSRIAGEGMDRTSGKADFYLSDEEQKQIEDCCALYKNVILVINSGSIVDLSFTDAHKEIKAILYAMQPGQEGGHAVSDLLCGNVVPSGKLTDSWGYSYDDYPAAATFSSNDGNSLKEPYAEGIYVGYRYFDSFDIPVRYSFGYGLSYTDFEISFEKLSVNEKAEAQLFVSVRNTGSFPGKETVQVYAALPEGKQKKEARRLVAYEKTPLLAPGEKCELTLTVNADALSSFDEELCAYTVEKGAYVIFVGNSLAASSAAAVLAVPGDKALKKVRHILPLKDELTELAPSCEASHKKAEEMKKLAEGLPSYTFDLSGIKTEAVSYEWTEPADEAADIVRGLTREQLVALATGDPTKGQDSNIGSSGISVPGSAGETSSCAVENGVASIALADGPAGLRINKEYKIKDGQIMRLPLAAAMEHGFLYDGEMPEGESMYQFCTAFPIGTLLAQTWDKELLYEVGRAVGEEMKRFGITLWLAPGMNIHRDPLCGRNFEYFSEDPLVAGRTAAAVTKGVGSVKGCSTTLKHFACNNQENDRMASDSIVSERALREIYLKGFETAIKEAKPLSIMTSYNLINGVHSANSYDLCTKFARCECGFDGLIMTDWSTTENGEDCTAAGCMRAGNDLVMPGKLTDRENIARSLEDGSLSEEVLRDCITRTVRVILKSDNYEE